MQAIRAVAAGCAVSALIACGGGGGGDSRPASGGTLTGTVAIGAPLAGVKVDALFSAFPTSAQVVSTTTDANGSYTITLPGGARPPFALRAGNFVQTANPAFPRLFSYSARAGTVNITPLTDLLVTRLMNRKQGFLGDTIGIANLAATDQAVAAATQQVKTYLQSRSASVNASAVADFVSTPFTPFPGNPYDDVMTALKQSLIAGENLMGIEEHMLSAGDIQTDYSQLFPLAFTANCIATQGGLPSGSTSISLQMNGITVGSYAYMFQQPTGDQILVDTGSEDTWTFSLNGTGGGTVVLRRNTDGNLSSLTLDIAGVIGQSQCAPSSPVSLAGKWPSMFAQVKRLANTITSGSITCTGGANTLSIDANGAVHAAPSGFTMSLISSPRIFVSADTAVVVVAFSTRMRSFFVVQSFGDASDTFSVSLTTVGAITSGQFSRTRGGVTTGC